MKDRRVAIVQSNYLPWKGYFDIIDSVDLFVFHDDLQYTKDDWRNRNLIKTEHGPRWLTVPCGRDENRLICEVEIKDKSWQKKHWNTIKQYYRKAAFFKNYRPFFDYFYLEKRWTNLSEMNQYLIRYISREFLGITTSFEDSRSLHLQNSKSSRVLEIAVKTGAGTYLSGPSAKAYLQTDDFEKHGIDICWMDYSGYPEYPQLFGTFDHEVSIIDLLFNTGPACRKYMKGSDDK